MFCCSKGHLFRFRVFSKDIVISVMVKHEFTEKSKASIKICIHMVKIQEQHVYPVHYN